MYVQDFVIPLNRGDLLNSADSGQYYVHIEYAIEEIRERLEAARTALNEEGTDFIVDHFPTYFSLLQKFKQSPQLAREKGWTSIRKAFTLLSLNLQALLEDTSNIDSEIQTKMCNISKMIVYILIEMMKSNQIVYTEQNPKVLDGKIKKKQIKLTDEECDWNSEKQSVLSEIYTFLQLPLKFLWEPPVVDEEFINLIANYCYNCLEDTNISNANSKLLREMIFQILGVLIRNYLHGLSFCVKVVQLLKMNDHLVNILAQGIVYLHQICNCTNIVKEIVREVADTDGDQLAADTTGTRNINLFLVQLAESIPEAIIPAIDLLISHLSGDSYSMRICVVGVLGEIVLSILTKENLDDNMKRMRDDYLDCLEEHIHDVNAFVRSRVLNIWQKLCVGKAIPISRLNRLLEMVIGRLNDKSTNVKKQSVHLIKDMLEGNPFCGELNNLEIRNQLEQEEKKLESIENTYNLNDSDAEWKTIEKKLQGILEDVDEKDWDTDTNDISAGSEEEMINTVGNYLCDGKYEKAVETLVSLKNEFYKVYNVQKETLSPETLTEIFHKIYKAKKKALLLNVPPDVQEKIEKHKATIEYLQNALEFTELIDRALPIILTLLDSNVVTDVLEAIHFFTAAYLFGLTKASEGVRKMLYLIFSKETSIKSAVSSTYQEIYFQRNGSGRQQSTMAVKSLGELVLQLNFSQLDALEEVMKQWVKDEVIDKNCVQVMFERFSKKQTGIGNDQSWAALVLIRMVGAKEPKIIKNNISVLLNEGLKKQGSRNFLVAKETCKALNYMLPPKEQGKPFDHTLRYPRDNEIFKILFNLLKIGIWRTNDPFYIPMAEEAINLVFAICDRPDEFSKNLIAELHEAILSGKRPITKKISTAGNILNNKKADDLYFGDPESNVVADSAENEEPVAEDEVEVGEEEVEANPNELYIKLLTRFISILGQVASNYILFLEGPVLDELKLRNQLEYERKLKKLEDNKKGNVSVRRNKKQESRDRTLNESGIEYLEFQRSTADDMDADEMKKKTENKVVTGDGFLAKFAPLILTICKNPGKYNNPALQNAALIALSKFMQVSSVFCEENLQLLVTICEKSQIPERQENAMIALGALQYKFPSTLEPWTPHMCAMLQSPNPSVRYTSILILTDLFVNEMIKVRHHVSNLVHCIVDKDIKIARVARHFFREYAQKGNSLYNVLPSLISNLTQTNSPLPEDEFKTVMKFILALVTKEKLSENLVEKLFQYFESATTERQWSDLAYCLSLLNYSDKGLKKILENVRCFANKLYLADVYEAFCTIVSDASKNPQKDKALVGELDALIKEYRGKTCEDKNQSIYAVPKRPVPPASVKKKVTRRKYLPSDSDEEFDIESARKPKNPLDKKGFPNDADEDEDELSQCAVSTRKRPPTRQPTGNAENYISNSDSDESVKRTRSKRTEASTQKITRPKQRKLKYSSEEDEDSEKEVVRTRSTRSCRKKNVTRSRE